MNVLLWHVHGSYTTALVQGPHTYLLPVLPDRGPDGLGRARTWDWPASAVELSPAELREHPVDVVILQRPHEAELAEQWLGRRPGRDVRAVYLEHDTPAHPVHERHPAADRPDLAVVHVTHFNRLMWDTGSTPATVVEHGVVDPGYRYDGSIERAGVVVNEPIRRGRMTGTDLVTSLGIPVDWFGMGTEALGGQDLTQAELHDALPRRRLYLHPNRWTSLGLSLIEAMHLGMPVAALATTEVPEAVPAPAGIVTNDPDRLASGIRTLLADPDAARAAGRCAREAALERYGLDRFVADWERVLAGDLP